MKKCRIKRYAKMRFCGRRYFLEATQWPLSFDDLCNERLDALQNIKDGYDKTLWREVIDNINELLNRIRINETPLRPAIFARSSYSTP